MYKIPRLFKSGLNAPTATNVALGRPVKEPVQGEGTAHLSSTGLQGRPSRLGSLHANSSRRPAPSQAKAEHRGRGRSFWDGVWIAGSAAHGPADANAGSTARAARRQRRAAAAAVQPTAAGFVSGFDLKTRIDHHYERQAFFRDMPLKKYFDWLKLIHASTAPVGRQMLDNGADSTGYLAGRKTHGAVGRVMTALTGQEVEPWAGPGNVAAPPGLAGRHPGNAQVSEKHTEPSRVRANLSTQVANVSGNAAFVTAVAAVHNVADQLTYIRQKEPIAPAWATKLHHEEVMEETKERVAALPQSIASQVRRIDQDILSILRHAHPAEKTEFSYVAATKVDYLLQRREFILCSHLLPKHDADYIDQPGPRAALDALANSYPDSTKKALNDFFSRIRKQKKAAAYFYGRPGTGKSTSAEAIGAALDRPVLHYSYAQFLSKEFLGVKEDWTMDRLDEAAEKFAGLFISDMIKHGRSDVIVSIGEVNFGTDPKAPEILELNSRMEKKVHEFINNGVVHSYDAIFIFNGNFPNDNIPATKERIPQITFTFEEPQKRKKALEVLDDVLAKHADELSAEQNAELKTMCERQLNFVIKCDLALGDGLRNIETVVDGMAERAFDSVKKGMPLGDDEMRERAMDDFKSVTVETPGFYEALMEEASEEFFDAEDGLSEDTPSNRAS